MAVAMKTVEEEVDLLVMPIECEFRGSLSGSIGSTSIQYKDRAEHNVT